MDEGIISDKIFVELYDSSDDLLSIITSHFAYDSNNFEIFKASAKPFLEWLK